MLSIENGEVVLNKGRLDIYIYQKYVGKMCDITGDIIKSIGILPYRWYAKWDDTVPTKIGTLKIPASVEFHPSEIKLSEEVKIYPQSDNKEYVVMTFFEKDKCWSNLMIQSMDAPMSFTESLLSAKLDTNIPYELLTPYWQTISLQNKVNFGVSGPAMDMIVRQICRYKGDKSILYATMLEKDPNIGQVSYQFMTSRELCADSGVFSSISFEDMNAMIDNSINITTSGKPQERSPIEDIIYL